MRRVVVSALLIASLVPSLAAWRDGKPDRRAVDGAAALIGAPSLTDDVALTTRRQTLTSDGVEHRTVKAGPRLGLALLVGLSVRVAVARARRRRLSARPRPTLWRRPNLALRAPPALRFS
jgi:hypothetical protein